MCGRSGHPVVWDVDNYRLLCQESCNLLCHVMSFIHSFCCWSRTIQCGCYISVTGIISHYVAHHCFLLNLLSHFLRVRFRSIQFSRIWMALRSVSLIFGVFVGWSWDLRHRDFLLFRVQLMSWAEWHASVIVYSKQQDICSCQFISVVDCVSLVLLVISYLFVFVLHHG